MELKRATIENKLFEELEVQWQGLISKYAESLDDYVPGFREHARDVIKGDYKNYFVYILTDNGAHIGFAHVGYAAIKGLSGYTVRAVEVFLSPDLDYEDVPYNRMAEIIAGFFYGLYSLAKDELKAQNVKMHIGPLDKNVLWAYINQLAPELGMTACMQGSWGVLKAN